MLKADKGINFPEFFIFMKTIAKTRIKDHKEDKLTAETSLHFSDKSLVLFDLKRVMFVLEDMITNKEFKAVDEEMGGNYIEDIQSLLCEIKRVIEEL